MVVLVARHHPRVDGAQDFGRDRVLVVGDIVCKGGGEAVSLRYGDETRVESAQLATSFWICVGVSIQHTSKMISMSGNDAFLSWSSLVACMRCSSCRVPSGMSWALHHSSRRVMLLFGHHRERVSVGHGVARDT